MKLKNLFAFALILIVTSTPTRAADDPRLAAVRAADDERVAATLAADRAKLTALYADELHYSHSTGGVDTKASLTEAIAGGKLKYLALEYQDRQFTFPAPASP